MSKVVKKLSKKLPCVISLLSLGWVGWVGGWAKSVFMAFGNYFVVSRRQKVWQGKVPFCLEGLGASYFGPTQTMTATIRPCSLSCKFQGCYSLHLTLHLTCVWLILWVGIISRLRKSILGHVITGSCCRISVSDIWNKN
jgi:hypothetical protein